MAVPGSSGYRHLSRLRTWLADHGHGPPVYLMHGGLSDGRDFRGNLDTLADSFRVLVPERRGHGHTADVEGPLSVQAQTSDAIELAEDLGTGAAAWVGYSAGAGVALRVAHERPELVSRLVLVSGALSSVHLAMAPRPEVGIDPAVREAYAEVSPDGADHLDVVAAKIAAEAESGPVLHLDEVGSVACPTLIVAGDDDVVSLEHTLALYRALPHAFLHVVPAASHLLLREQADLVTGTVRTFLEDGFGPRLMPITRGG